MWYGPSRLVWNAMRFPSGLHTGRRFDALVCVSWRIGDAPTVVPPLTNATHAARHSTRTSSMRVISAPDRRAFRHKPVALPRQQGREQPYGQTTQQEGCLRRKALVLRGLRHERVHDHEDREHGVQRGPDEGQQRGERLHSSSPPAALAGATRGAGASDALARPVRSEEHTSELQSHSELVCRLLLEKK